MQTFAERLKIVMDTQGVSLRELARRSGVDASTLSKILRGMQSPRLDTLEAIAAGLNVTPAFLIGLTDGLSPDVRVLAEAIDKLPPQSRQWVLHFAWQMATLGGTFQHVAAGA